MWNRAYSHISVLFFVVLLLYIKGLSPEEGIGTNSHTNHEHKIFADSGSISGTILIDKNNDCLIDGTSEPFENLTVFLIESKSLDTVAVKTDNNGFYRAKLPYADHLIVFERKGVEIIEACNSIYRHTLDANNRIINYSVIIKDDLICRNKLEIEFDVTSIQASCDSNYIFQCRIADTIGLGINAANLRLQSSRQFPLLLDSVTPSNFFDGNFELEPFEEKDVKFYYRVSCDKGVPRSEDDISVLYIPSGDCLATGSYHEEKIQVRFPFYCKSVYVNNPKDENHTLKCGSNYMSKFEVRSHTRINQQNLKCTLTVDPNLIIQGVNHQYSLVNQSSAEIFLPNMDSLDEIELEIEFGNKCNYNNDKIIPSYFSLLIEHEDSRCKFPEESTYLYEDSIILYGSYYDVNCAFDKILCNERMSIELDPRLNSEFPARVNLIYPSLQRPVKIEIIPDPGGTNFDDVRMDIGSGRCPDFVSKKYNGRNYRLSSTKTVEYDSRFNEDLIIFFYTNGVDPVSFSVRITPAFNTRFHLPDPQPIPNIDWQRKLDNYYIRIEPWLHDISWFLSEYSANTLTMTGATFNFQGDTIVTLDSLPMNATLNTKLFVEKDNDVCLEAEGSVSWLIDEPNVERNGRIEGNVRIVKQDCSSQTSVPIKNQMIVVENRSYKFIAYTNESGDYMFNIPRGDYRLSVPYLDTVGSNRICRGRDIIQVIENKTINNTTTYVESDFCQNLFIDFLPGVFNEFDDAEAIIDILVYNMSPNPLLPADIRFSIDSPAELKWDGQFFEQTGPQDGVFHLPEMDPGEERIFIIKIKSEFHSRVRMNFNLSDDGICSRIDTLHFSGFWKIFKSGEFEYLNYGHQGKFSNDYMVQSVYRFPVEIGDTISNRFFEIESSYDFDPNYLILDNSERNCTQLYFSKNNPRKVNIIYDCPIIDPGTKFLSYRFKPKNQPQRKRNFISPKYKLGFDDFITIKVDDVLSQTTRVYVDSLAVNLSESPVICDFETGINAQLVVEDASGDGFTLYDCNRNLLNLNQAQWFAFSGNGNKVKISLTGRSNGQGSCNPFILGGILEGYENDNNWIVCPSSTLHGEEFNTRDSTNYYVCILNPDTLNCDFLELILSSERQIYHSYPEKIPNARIEGANCQSGIVNVCYDLDVNNLPRMRLEIEDSIYTKMNQFACFEHRIIGNSNVNYRLFMDYGIPEGPCRTNLIEDGIIGLEDQSQFVRVKGTLHSEIDGNCNFDSGLGKFKNACIQLKSASDNHVIRLDNSGKFDQYFQPGIFNLHDFTYAGGPVEPCKTNSSFSVTNGSSSMNVDLVVQSENTCSILDLNSSPKDRKLIYASGDYEYRFYVSKSDHIPSLNVVSVNLGDNITLDSISVPFQFNPINSAIVELNLLEIQDSLPIDVYFHVDSYQETPEDTYIKVFQTDYSCLGNYIADTICEFYKFVPHKAGCFGARRICTQDTFNFYFGQYPLDSDYFPRDTFCNGRQINWTSWLTFRCKQGYDSIKINYDFDCSDIQYELYKDNCYHGELINCSTKRGSRPQIIRANFEENVDYYLQVRDFGPGDCLLQFISINILDCDEIYTPSDTIRYGLVGSCSSYRLFLRPPRTNIGSLYHTWIIGLDTFRSVDNNRVWIDAPTSGEVQVKLVSSFSNRDSSVVITDSIVNTISSSPLINQLSYLSGTVGFVYDCQFPVEAYLQGIPVSLNSGGSWFQTLSDSNGFYEFCVQPDIYQIDFDLDGLLMDKTCSQKSFVDLIRNDSLIHEVRVINEVQCKAMHMELSSIRRFRCGAPSYQLDFSVANFSGVLLKDKEILVDVDSFLTISHWTQSPYIKSADIIDQHRVLFNLDSLPRYGKMKLELVVRPYCDDMDLDETFCMKAFFTSPQLSCRGDTAFNRCIIIGNSYDPNDLQVFPQGETERHYIENLIPLEYLIRYQNKGTDTAFNIRIEHAFSHPIVPETFVLLDKSANKIQVNIPIAGDNKLVEFVLPEALLPHESIDKVGSNGHILFSVVVDSLGELEKHSSLVDIYFDYNPAIQTNSVFHTITTDYFYGSKKINICEGSEYYGNTISMDTNTLDTLMIPGPDSIILSEISVLNSPHSRLDFQICPGDYLEFDNRFLFAEGDYSFDYTASNGCDSIVDLNLKFKDYQEVHIDSQAYVGFVFRGIQINSDTTLAYFSSTQSSCVDTFYHLRTSPTSVSKFGADNWYIYPVPAANSLIIDRRLSDHTSIDRGQIWNSMGEAVMKFTDLATPHRFEIGNLPSGLYYLELHVFEEKMVYPFIKL